MIDFPLPYDGDPSYKSDFGMIRDLPINQYPASAAKVDNEYYTFYFFWPMSKAKYDDFVENGAMLLFTEENILSYTEYFTLCGFKLYDTYGVETDKSLLLQLKFYEDEGDDGTYYTALRFLEHNEDGTNSVLMENEWALQGAQYTPNTGSVSIYFSSLVTADPDENRPIWGFGLAFHRVDPGSVTATGNGGMFVYLDDIFGLYDRGYRINSSEVPHHVDVGEDVRNLLKRDGVAKMFHVGFPDGDHPDLLNDVLIKESMKFEENLASRTPVKFGLCEGNVISFQCAGLDNIKRKRIHVSMGVDISSLSEDVINRYGTRDDNTPFPYYLFDYGDFIITSCERDSASGVRKVIGTSKGLSGNNDYVVEMNNAIEYDKRKLFFYTYSSPQSTHFFEPSSYAAIQGQEIFRPLYTDPIDETYTYTSTWTTSYHFTKWNGERVTLSIHSTITYLSATLAGGGNSPIWEVRDVYCVKQTEQYLTQVKEALDAYDDFMSERYNPDYNKSNWKNQKSFFEHPLTGSLFSTHWYAYDNVTDPVERTVTYINLPLGWLYAKFGKLFYGSGEHISIPIRHEITMSDGTDTLSLVIDKGSDGVFLGHGVANAPILEMRTISTQQVKIGSATRYTPALVIEKINIRTLMQDTLELKGKFGGLGRGGYFREYTLFDSTGLFPRDDLLPSDDLYPQQQNNYASIDASEVISAKCDEFVFYYKGIYVEYKNHDDEDCEYEVLFDSNDDNPDMPYYDLSKNGIISSGKYTQSELTTLIAPLVAALRKFRYYQSDITMRAMPYIEVGDTLYFRLRNETIVTPALTQTISGIQDLRSRIVSR